MASSPLEQLPSCKRRKIAAARPVCINDLSAEILKEVATIHIWHLHLGYYLLSPPLPLSAHMKPSWLEADLKSRKVHPLQAQIGPHSISDR
jgi:hypothetical protein